MEKKNKLWRHSGHCRFFALLLSTLFFSPMTSATTGYFAVGYGPKSTGMAGTVVAAPQDAMIASVNPAGMGLVGERVDFSLRLFSPIREAELDTTAVGARFRINNESGRDFFVIPNFGITKQINNKVWAGLTVYANGGMNTTYDVNLYDQTAAVLGAFATGGSAATASVPSGTTTGTPDTGTLGVDLAQLIIAPTLTFQIHQKHTLGLSLLLGVQRFEAYGLGNFQCFTPTGSGNNPSACAPGGAGALTPGFVPSKNLTNNGHDWSYGFGIKVGWIGQIHPRLTLGFAAASKIYMTEFDEYSELFAGKGDFDIPGNLTVGVAFHASPDLTLAFDYQRIFYSGVDSVGNAGPVPTPLGPGLPPGLSLLGLENGIGFGWKDISVYRIGMKYDWNPGWTIRAGYSYNDSPIPDDQILFNILAPAVNKHHLTFGFTYTPSEHSEWTFAYIHAFDETQRTPRSAFGIPASIGMYQNSIELEYSHRF